MGFLFRSLLNCLYNFRFAYTTSSFTAFLFALKYGERNLPLESSYYASFIKSEDVIGAKATIEVNSPQLLIR
jgi:hypothetical protein